MNDRMTGTLLMVAAAGILILYTYGLLFFTIEVLQITAFVAATTLLGLVGWIGYSIATTSPPPPPIESEVQAQPKAEQAPEKPSS